MSTSSKRRGLPKQFISQQSQTLSGEGERLDRRLQEVQEAARQVDEARAELERARAELATAPTSPSPSFTLLPLKALQLSGEAQSRVFVDPQVVSEYTERMRRDDQSGAILDPEGSAWTPIRVYAERAAQGDEVSYWVADGFHRVAAARELNFDSVPCEIIEGTRRDAIRESLSANARHGLRRTRADKRRAVERALHDEEWRQWTDQRLADLCAVSRAMVTQARADLEQREVIPFEPALYSSDGREFEREPSQVMSAPSALAQKEAPAPKKKSTQRKRGLRTLDWKRAGVREGERVIVAYPAGESHYQKLCEVAGGDAAIERVICPLMSGTPWLWKGPALLDALVEEHGFSQPQVIECVELKKWFVCWSRQRAALDDRTSRDTLLGEGDTLLLGQVLDTWDS